MESNNFSSRPSSTGLDRQTPLEFELPILSHTNRSPSPSEFDQSQFNDFEDSDNLSVDGDEDSKRIQREELAYWNQQLLSQREKDMLYLNQLQLDEHKRQNQAGDKGTKLAESFVDFLYEELAVEKRKDLNTKGYDRDNSYSTLEVGSSSLGGAETETHIIRGSVDYGSNEAETEMRNTTVVISEADKDPKLEEEKREEILIEAPELIEVQEAEDAPEIGIVQDTKPTQELEKEVELVKPEEYERKTIEVGEDESMDRIQSPIILQKESKIDDTMDAAISTARQNEEEVKEDQDPSSSDDFYHLEEQDEQYEQYEQQEQQEQQEQHEEREEQHKEVTSATSTIQAQSSKQVESPTRTKSRISAVDISSQQHMTENDSKTQTLNQKAQHQIKLLQLKRQHAPHGSKPPVIPVGKHEVKLLSLMNTRKL